MLLFTWLLLFQRYLKHERVACIISPIGACSLYFYSCFMGELAPLNRSVEGHWDCDRDPQFTGIKQAEGGSSPLLPCKEK